MDREKKSIDPFICVVLQSHFWLCKALDPEWKIVKKATIAYDPSSMQGRS